VLAWGDGSEEFGDARVAPSNIDHGLTMR